MTQTLSSECLSYKGKDTQMKMNWYEKENERRELEREMRANAKPEERDVRNAVQVRAENARRHAAAMRAGAK